MTNLAIAEEIRNQLGNQALRMLGADNLCGTENSLQFKIKGSKKVKHIEITLNSFDSYNITFSTWRGSTIKRDVVENIYIDKLHKTIEEKTGLYTKI